MKVVAINRRPLTWPVRVAIGLAASAPVGWLLLRGRGQAEPLLASGALFWPSTFAFGLFFTWAFARRHWRHPRPCPPGTRRRRTLVAGTFLLYLVPCLIAAMVISWLHAPTVESINRVFGVSNDIALWGFALNGRTVTSPYLGPQHPIQLNSAKLRAARQGQLVQLTLRRGVLGALYVHKVELRETP